MKPAVASCSIRAEKRRAYQGKANAAVDGDGDGDGDGDYNDDEEKDEAWQRYQQLQWTRCSLTIALHINIPALKYIEGKYYALILSVFHSMNEQERLSLSIQLLAAKHSILSRLA